MATSPRELHVRLERIDRQRIVATGREALKGSSKNTSATRAERGNELAAQDSGRGEGPIQVRVAWTIAIFHSTANHRAHIIRVL